MQNSYKNIIPSSGVGERIKLARKAVCMSQLDLAKATGIAQSSLAGIENDSYMPTEDKIEIISHALKDIRADWLILSSGSPLPQNLLILNPCRKRINQKAAIHLIKQALPHSGLLIKNKNDLLLIFQHTNIAVLRLCKPYEIQALCQDLNIRYLGSERTAESYENDNFLLKLFFKADKALKEVHHCIVSTCPELIEDLEESIRLNDLDKLIGLYKKAIILLARKLSDSL